MSHYNNHNLELDLLLKNYKEPEIKKNTNNNLNIEDKIRNLYEEQIRFYKFVKDTNKIKKGSCLRFVRKDLKNISTVYMIKNVIRDAENNVKCLEITEIYGYSNYKINPDNYYLFTNYGNNINKMKSNPIYSTEIARMSSLFDDNYVKEDFDEQINSFIK